MRKLTRHLIPAVLALCLVPMPSSAADSTAELDRIRANAENYLQSENYYFEYIELIKYADTAKALADSGVISHAAADVAAGWRDSLEFSPELYLTEKDSDCDIFLGSDGVFADGANAVRLNVPFTHAEVSDFYCLIPSTTDELCILVNLTVTGEKMLRGISFGKHDDELATALRQMSLIEGRVELAFCPAPNSMKNTRTLAQSYRDAFRYVAEMADRYAPNVRMVYAISDERTPGANTAEWFYPGDEYVDAYGVELAVTYNKSHLPSPEAAFDCRGTYYDPVKSVIRTAEELREVGGDKPLIITGCSFPWEGKAAVTDWQTQMERFYRLIPIVLPETVAIFYTNASTSRGIANLRYNSEAMAAYGNCMTLARGTAAKITDGTALTAGKTYSLAMSATGKFSGASWTVKLDGTACDPDNLILTAEEHTLELYVYQGNLYSKKTWKLTPGKNGTLTAASVAPANDFNGNGYLDFGDTELLAAHIADWDVDLRGIDPDVNGDLRVNIMDVSALRVSMKP